MSNKPNHRQLTGGTLLMCAVVLIWGAFLPVSKVALAVIDPYWLTLLRYGAAALCLLATLVFIEGRGALSCRGQTAQVWIFGSVGFAGFSLLVYEGLRLTRPEHGAMILALGPVNIVLWQWLRTRHRPPAATLACIAAALAGEALVVSQGEWARLYSGGGALGNGLIYLASCCWIAFTLGAQRFPGWSPLRYTALTSAFGWPTILLAVALATASGHSHAPATVESLREVLWALLFVVFAVSFAAVLLWNMAVAKLGPLNAALFANFAPVVTFLITVGQGHRLLWVEIAGAALVVGALVANNLVNRRLARQSEQILTATRPALR
ncbi:MAG: DMT family transporter [Zoogloeaceae bacterium]|jgi:drug/metabolite transporter (DMT)-like permease|nr:DMT family transporter [Zoogloeaceae bacterium]